MRKLSCWGQYAGEYDERTKEVLFKVYTRSTQATLIGPQPMYSAIHSWFEKSPHLTYFGPQKPDQSSMHFNSRPSSCQLRKCGSVLSPTSKKEKFQHSSLATLSTIPSDSQQSKRDSHLTASTITCNELHTSMFSYCNIHSISIQINKCSFKCKGWN